MMEYQKFLYMPSAQARSVWEKCIPLYNFDYKICLQLSSLDVRVHVEIICLFSHTYNTFLHFRTTFLSDQCKMQYLGLLAIYEFTCMLWLSNKVLYVIHSMYEVHYPSLVCLLLHILPLFATMYYTRIIWQPHLLFTQVFSFLFAS